MIEHVHCSFIDYSSNFLWNFLKHLLKTFTNMRWYLPVKLRPFLAVYYSYVRTRKPNKLAIYCRRIETNSRSIARLSCVQDKSINTRNSAVKALN